MRIWFNHWFSTAFRIMELLKEGCIQNNINIEIIGTNKIDICVYKTYCDEFYVEPADISDIEYIDWCIEFCKAHKIDVFIPRRNREVISKYISEFDKLGIKVMIDRNFQLLELLEDKYATARLFEDNNICKVPKIFIVNNVCEFEKAYQALKDLYPNDRVCIKYNKDEGATSFRVIDNHLDDISSLKTGVGLKLSYNQVFTMLGSVESFDDLIVMPYLKGPEISVDSLMTKEGFIGISRYKVGTRSTQVEYNSEFYEISKKFAEVTGLQMPYNVQLRHHNDEWYLLEVNTRMAGGTYKSCLSGINIPYFALCELLGLPFELPNVSSIQSMLISEIETPVILK